MDFKLLLSRVRKRFEEIFEWEGDERQRYADVMDSAIRVSKIQGVDQVDSYVELIASLMAEAAHGYVILMEPKITKDELIEFIDGRVGREFHRFHKRKSGELAEMYDRFVEIANHYVVAPSIEGIDARLMICSILLINLIRVVLLGKEMSRRN